MVSMITQLLRKSWKIEEGGKVKGAGNKKEGEERKKKKKEREREGEMGDYGGDSRSGDCKPRCTQRGQNYDGGEFTVANC